MLLSLILFLCACGAQEEAAKPAHSASLYARDANNAAVKALENGDLKTALEKANEAIEDDPEFAMPYYNRALAHLLNGEHQPASESMLKCVELAPEHGEAQLLLGLMLERDGKISDSSTHYAAAKTAFTKTPSAHAGTEIYLAISTYLSDGLAPGLEAMDILVAKYPRNPLYQDVREHMRKGERDFFQTWLLEQQSKLAQIQTMKSVPVEPKTPQTPGTEPTPEKETSDAP